MTGSSVVTVSATWITSAVICFRRAAPPAAWRSLLNIPKKSLKPFVLQSL